MPRGFEIERKYLLDAMPDLPSGAEPWKIEQGYLSPSRPPIDQAPRVDDVEFGYGRLRRTIMPDGSVVCTHTLKIGSGLQRMEQEREISHQDFERHWPRTEGRRLSKTRWRVKHGAVTWEVDDIENGWLAVAEVELETPDQVVTTPQWLAEHIVREVTDDVMYTNSSIAERVGKGATKG
jgi:adenylate cyclase